MCIRKVETGCGGYGFLCIPVYGFFLDGIKDNRTFVLVFRQILKAVTPMIILCEILRAACSISTVQLNLYISGANAVSVIAIIPCLRDCFTDGFRCVRVRNAQDISGIIGRDFSGISINSILCDCVGDFSAVIEEYRQVLKGLRETGIFCKRCLVCFSVRARKCDCHRIRAHTVLVRGILPILVNNNIRNGRNMFVSYCESGIGIAFDFIGIAIDCFLVQRVVNRNAFHPITGQVFEFVFPLPCCCQVCFIHISIRTHQCDVDGRRTNAILVSIVFPSLRNGDAECFLHMAVRDCERAAFVRNGVGIPCYCIFCNCIGDFVTVRIKQRHMLKGILPILCIAQCCFRRRTIRAVQVDSNTVGTHTINVITVIPDFSNRKVVKLWDMLICNGDSVAFISRTCCSAYRSGITIHRVFDDSILDCLSFIISGN